MSAQDVSYSPSSKLFLLLHKPNPITTVRFAHQDDLPALKKMVHAYTYSTFGQDDIDRIFHLSTAGLVCTTSTDEIVGCIFVSTFPNVPSLPTSDWESWIRSIYNLEEANSRTTTFIHFALYEQPYSRDFLNPILTRLFRTYPLLQFTILVIPPKVKFLDWTGTTGTIIRSNTPDVSQTLQVYLRRDYVNSYRIRMGVMEDNDDLVPMIDTLSKRLKNNYGNYYIAEMIARDNKREVIVAEYKEKTVGVMVFNEDIDYDTLNRNFHLECFYGLKKPSGFDWCHTKKSPNLNESYFNYSLRSLQINSAYSLVASIGSTIGSMTGKEESIQTSLLQTKGEINSISMNLNDHIDDIPFSYSSSLSQIITIEPENKSKDKKNQILMDSNSFSSYLLTYPELIPKHSSQNQKCLLPNQTYKGDGNAFAMEIAASNPDREQCLFSILQAGFELYPKKDYCILCLPTNAPAFPLISRAMVRVSPLPLSQFTHELYVCHKNSIFGEVKVRRPIEDDLSSVEDLLTGITNWKDVFKQFLNGFYSKTDDVQSYIIKCNKDTIGIVNLKDMTNLEYVLNRYQVSKVTDLNVHKPGNFGRILHFVLSPIFQRYCKFILMELHRLSDYTILFYFVYPNSRSRAVYDKVALATVLGDLIPVLPTKGPEYRNLRRSQFWKITEFAGNDDKPFAVYVSTPVYCGLRRTAINTRIVVVGASETGLSFLINLIFHNNKNAHTYFTNVTLVSTHGLPSHKSNNIKDNMIPITSEVSSGKYLSMISLPTFVNVIEGVMSSIDRKKKSISVNSTWFGYDILILTCGTQFQMPKRTTLGKETFDECPENVFIINTPFDVDVAIENLRKLISENENLDNLIVYGNSIQTYCCIESLLDLNLTNLIFIEKERIDQGNETTFDDEEVEKSIKRRMEKAGVKVYENFLFHDWIYDEDLKRITNIKFQGGKVDIPCTAVFMYEKKQISKSTFNAINNANLIYDGGLVINLDFKTNDPDIYAAGTITKYPRRFYADHMIHKYFNQDEIGKKLAQVILKRLVPDLEFLQPFKDRCFDEKKMLVPRYYEPVYIYAKLPRKLEYFMIKKPGNPIPLNIYEQEDVLGKTITTGNLHLLRSQGYFKLRLNQYNTVEMILAVSKTTIDTNNLYHLWGKHESLLNNLLERYQMGLIDDLFDFFSEPWIYALYHDGYSNLHQELNNTLISLSETPGTSVIEDVIEKIKNNNFRKLNNEQFNQVMDKLKDSDYYMEMENKVMDFLTEHITHLPMYLTPAMKNIILGAYEESPLFKQM